MRLTNEEIGKKIENARSLEEYIEWYLYKMNNIVYSSSELIRLTTEKAMIDDIRKFVRIDKLTTDEFQQSYKVLIGAIYRANMNIQTLKGGLSYLEHEIIPEEEEHIEFQKTSVREKIHELELEKDGYKKSIKLLVKLTES